MSQDFVITWILQSPKSYRSISNRIKDAKIQYSIDSGAWQSKPLTISKIDDSTIQIIGRIDQFELANHKQIQCFIQYVFDGTQQKHDPRTIEIKMENKAQ